MRILLAGCGVIALCLIVAGFMLARKSKAALFPGVLVEQVDKLTAGWTAQNTPETDRVVDLIISDSEEEAPEEKPEEKAAAYSSEDMEVLSSASKPSATAKIGTWFRRTFFRRSMKAPEDTAFVESLAGKPGAVTWTHKGDETASEDEMMREFMRAILKADDAGAVVNIITQGKAAAAAFRAVKLLQKVKRPNGRIPTVAKVVAVNMNRPTLQRINSGFFTNYSKPENLREIVYIWNPPAEPKRVILEVFTPGYNKVRFDGGELFAMMGGRGGGAQDVFRLIEVMAKNIYTMEAVIGRLAAKVEEKKEAVRAAARAGAAGQIAAAKKEEEERAAAQAAAEAKAKAEAKKTYTAEAVARDLKGRVVKKAEPKPQQPQTRQTDNKRGNGANCKGNPPQCNWWDAKAYCGGSLPSVAQLQADYRSECTGGRNGPTCSGWYWSGEETSANYARYVAFNHGTVGEDGKARPQHPRPLSVRPV